MPFMLDQSIILLSIVLQFIAAFLSLRLIKITGRRRAWLFISMALTLMTVRRIITYYKMLVEDIHVNLPAEITALIISILMLIGISLIAPIFTMIKKSEESIRRNEEKYRTLFQSSGEAIIVTNELGFIVDINNKACDLLRYTPKELLKMNIAELVVGNFEENLDEYKVFHQNMSIWKTYSTEIKQHSFHTEDRQFRRKDRTMFDYDVNCVYMPDSTVVAHIHDITNRKKSVNAMKNMNIELEKRNKELEDFVYIASHDLQEPLRKVQTFSDRIIVKFGDQISDQIKDYLLRMQNASKRMQTLIQDLLTMSRLTTTAKPFTIVDLNDIAKGVINDLEVTIEQSHSTIEMNHLPTIEGDPTQLRQLIQNLLSNAIKFRQQNIPPIVKISYTSDPFSLNSENINKKFQLIIHDNGVGFDPQYSERIFGLFQRLKDHQEYEGTGIGLAICKKIVERHSGTIKAESSPGQGSKIIVTLPYKQQNNDYLEFSPD